MNIIHSHKLSGSAFKYGMKLVFYIQTTLKTTCTIHSAIINLSFQKPVTKPHDEDSKPHRFSQDVSALREENFVSYSAHERTSNQLHTPVQKDPFSG